VKEKIPGLASLLKGAGISGPPEIHRLRGGANNRVYRVDAGGTSFLAKVYFRHAGDRRDRFGSEVAFLDFALKRGLACVPRVVAADAVRCTALLEFVRGRELRRGEATWPRIAETLEFFAGLNRDRTSAPAGRLPAASEACFSLGAHLACVDRRLDRLRRLRAASAAGRDAVRFIGRRLAPAWEAVSRKIRSSSGSLSAEIPRAARCISPSDFGFHNALLRPGGRLCFMDFEYAGWDDPAKTACDFFCQPALPVDCRHIDRFVEAISPGLDDPVLLRSRVRTLLPVYRLKWCCILLNEFLPAGDARRTFASEEGDPEERKADQLKKAKAAFKEWDR
jgi:hypothetical protein